MSEYSPHYGFASHVVSEAFKIEGVKVIWEFYPWRRSYITAERGDDAEAGCCWWNSEDVQKAFLVSETIIENTVVFFYLTDYKFDWKSIDDLEGLRIGGTFEYEYSKKFMDAMNENRISVETVPRDELNYRKLLYGRINIFPNDLIVGYSLIRNNFSPDEEKRFTHHPKELESNSLNLIISKQIMNGKLYLEKFNSGFKKLKDSGRYDQMLNDVMNGKYDKQETKWME